MGVNSLPKTVTRQRRGCNLNSGPSVPESSMLTSRLPSHLLSAITEVKLAMTVPINFSWRAINWLIRGHLSAICIDVVARGDISLHATIYNSSLYRYTVRQKSMP